MKFPDSDELEAGLPDIVAEFAVRFGTEAIKLANPRRGKKLCLRGIDAKVFRPGLVVAGDRVRNVQGGEFR